MKRSTTKLSAFAVLCVLAGAVSLASSLQRAAADEQAKPERDDAAQGLADELIGTWKLAEAQNPGSPSGIDTRLKMFTGTHWCVIQPDPDTGVIVFQHGGRYKVEGDTVKTNRDFAGESTKVLIGGRGSLKIQIKGDTLKQADSDGKFNETWKRVK